MENHTKAYDLSSSSTDISMKQRKWGEQMVNWHCICPCRIVEGEFKRVFMDDKRLVPQMYIRVTVRVQRAKQDEFHVTVGIQMYLNHHLICLFILFERLPQFRAIRSIITELFNQ